MAQATRNRSAERKRSESQSDLAAVALAAGEPALFERAASALERGGLSVAAKGDTPSDWEPTDLATVAVAVVCAEIAAPAQGAQLRELKAQLGGMRTIMVCASPGAIGVRRLLDAGVEGLVLEDVLELALAPTVYAVLADQIVVPSSARRQLEKPALTTREKQVLGMVTLDFSNSEIARKLFLAESTVKSHLSSAFAKLGVRSRSEATAVILDPEGPLGPGILRISSDNGRE